METKKKDVVQEAEAALEKKYDALHDRMTQGQLFDDDELAKAGAVGGSPQQRQNLADAEQLLDQILQQKKKQWWTIYRILKDVRDTDAFAVEYKSFTSWVSHYSKQRNVTGTIIWRYYRAGKYYEEMDACKRKMGAPLDFKAEALSPDNMELISRITRNDPQKGAELAVETVKGHLGRSKLNRMWKTEKAFRAAQKEKISLANGYDHYDKTKNNEAPTEQAPESQMNAHDIVTALSRGPEWLPGIVTDKPPYCRDQYLCVPEFPVRVPGSTLRMDLLILENHTVPASESNFELKLHGVEIKVSKSDLERDTKMQEYTTFVDDFWLAVPDDAPELVNAALDRVEDNPGWGLMLIHEDGSIEVDTAADGDKMREDGDDVGVMREQALMTFAVRAMLKG